MNPLTPRQNQVYLYIKTYIYVHGYAPSLGDIGGEFKMSRKSAFDLAAILKRKEYIETTPGVARSIIIKG